MSEEIISMNDMMAVYEVTDEFGIDRESISVPLEKSGDGNVEKASDGAIQITVPATLHVRDWLDELRAALLELGYEVQSEGELWG